MAADTSLVLEALRAIIEDQNKKNDIKWFVKDSLSKKECVEIFSIDPNDPQLSDKNLFKFRRVLNFSFGISGNILFSAPESDYVHYKPAGKPSQ